MLLAVVNFQSLPLWGAAERTQVVEGTQVRLLRMLFRSLPVGARRLSETHADFLQKLGNFHLGSL